LAVRKANRFAHPRSGLQETVKRSAQAKEPPQASSHFSDKL